MRPLLIGSVAALAATLAGCDGRSETNVVAEGPENVQNQLEAMSEGQRNAVFVRAIRDAGEDCQHVESSEPVGEHRGFPVWNATCQGGGTWTIVIENDGRAAVLNDAERRLVGVNRIEPEADPSGASTPAANAQGE